MRVLVTGASGMLGGRIAAASRALHGDNAVVAPARAEVDLRDRAAVRHLLEAAKPDVVIHAAAKVAGIGERAQHPTRFLTDNLAIDLGVIESSLEAGVRSLLYVSSAGIYPAGAPQPIREEAILTGPLEPEMEPYALAKLAGTRLCEYASREHGVAYRAAVPCNMFGPGEKSDLGRGHLLAAALHKVRDAVVTGASEVEVWGDGTARREYVYADDVATWLASQAGHLDAWPAMLNVGFGTDHSVREYYEMALAAAGCTATLRFDPSRPVGVHARLLDSSRARELGWHPRTDIADAVEATYREIAAPTT